MKRKTIQLAKNTLVLSLPAKWVKQHGVQKGTSLEVSTHGPTLKIQAFDRPSNKEIEVNVKELSERMLKWTLSSLYKKGYTQITIYNPSKDQLSTIRDQTKSQFIGFAVVDQRKNSCTLRSIATEDPQAFETSLRRAFLVTLSMADQVLEHLRNEQDPVDLLELEQTNNQLIDFCQRLINSERIDKKDYTFRYIIAWNLEKICDEYKYIINHVKELPSHSSILFFEDVNKLLRDYYRLIYDYDSDSMLKSDETAIKLWDEGYELLSKKDKILAHHLLKIVSHSRDFSSSIIALNN